MERKGGDRRLAAILAADVVGYSRLMGGDEAGTHARLKALRKEFIEPTIAAHHGRIVKLTGDGALVEFASAVDAVTCAVAVQNGIAERNADVAEAEQLWLRIGINIGDVIFEDGDIYGDGVNVAARLEGLAEPGSICIARNVYNHVKTKVAFGFEPMGEHQIKNITEPVTIFRVIPDPGPVAKVIGLKRAGTPKWRLAALAAVAAAVVLVASAAGTGWWLWPGTPGGETARKVADGAAEAKEALPLPDKPSIAVLPFDNLSGQERYERLADGLTEDIITDLSRFRELFVIARNSTFVYKDKPTDVRQIARELGVQYVLEGSLQVERNRARVTAQLIDAATGNHVWSERFDRPLDDVFAIQGEVTQTITASLGGTQGALARAGRETARRKPAASLQAYEYYLLGVESKHRLTGESTNKAQEFFRRALELDPNYALAHIGLALTYELEVFFGWGESWQKSMDDMRAASEMAIALDPYSSLARVPLGMYYRYLNDYQRSVAEFTKALELNPNNADALVLAAETFVRAGEPERALESAEQAIRLNPHHPDWYYDPLSEAYIYNRRFEEAAAATRKRVDPSPMWDPLRRAMSYAQLGRNDEVAREVAAMFDESPDWSAEKHLSETGTFGRDVELNLFLDSIEKAGLPLCASQKQLERDPDMKRLEQCEAEQARS